MRSQFIIYIRKKRVSLTEAKPVNQEKSIQTLRIRLCIWSSEQRSIKTNIFEILSISFEKCIYLKNKIKKTLLRTLKRKDAKLGVCFN